MVAQDTMDLVSQEASEHSPLVATLDDMQIIEEPETVEMKEEWYLQSMVRPRECIDRMMTVLHKAMHAFAK